jgi:CrcB protein
MSSQALALVFVCGGSGAVLRVWLHAQLLARSISGNWSTTIINLIGCFVAGILSDMIGFQSPTIRLAVFGGFLGGFTTMSAFAFDSAILLNQRSTLYGIGFVTCTVVGCIASFMLGSNLMRGFK